MQDALDHPYDRKIADILLQVKGQGLFCLVALRISASRGLSPQHSWLTTHRQ